MIEEKKGGWEEGIIRDREDQRKEDVHAQFKGRLH